MSTRLLFEFSLTARTTYLAHMRQFRNLEVILAQEIEAAYLMSSRPMRVPSSRGRMTKRDILYQT